MACKILDLRGVARHCGVEETTPGQWRQRNVLPPSDFPEIRGCPLWYLDTIRQWALDTGRAFYEDPDKWSDVDEIDDHQSSDDSEIPPLVFSGAA